jgi:hypothetical protein
MAQAKNKGLKRMRSESGVMVRASSKEQGEMYEKWKKKRKREINTEDDGHDIDYRKRPKFRINAHVKDELRTPGQIKKIVKQRENLKLKNMEKGKRTKIENSMRQKKKQGFGDKSRSGGGKGGGMRKGRQ